MPVIKSDLPKERTSKYIQHKTWGRFRENCLIKSYVTLQLDTIRKILKKKKKILTAKIRHLDSQEVQEKKNHSTHATNNIYNHTDYLTKRSLRDDTQDQNAQNSRLL